MMKRILSAVLVAVFAVALLASCKGQKDDSEKNKTAKRYTFYSLDTDCSLTVYGADDSYANVAADAVDVINKFFSDGKNISLADKGTTLSFSEEQYALLKKGAEM